MRIYRPLKILIVEDEPAYALLIQDTIEKGLIRSDINIMGNGEDALKFLLKQDEFSNVFTPELIILDLHLPGHKSGYDILEFLKLPDNKLRRVPVIVFSACNDTQKINQAYDLNANAFVCKTHDYQEFLRIIKAVEQFWMHVVQLPFEEYCL